MLLIVISRSLSLSENRLDFLYESNSGVIVCVCGGVCKDVFNTQVVVMTL